MRGPEVSTLPLAECVLVCILTEVKEQTFHLFSQASEKGVLLVSQGFMNLRAAEYKGGG